MHALDFGSIMRFGQIEYISQQLQITEKGLKD